MVLKELVQLKGSGDGIRIILSEHDEFSAILNEIYDKIRSQRKFFKGVCNVYIMGREITHPDKLRINCVLKSLIPECSIFYGENKISKKESYNKNQSHTYEHSIKGEQIQMKNEEYDIYEEGKHKASKIKNTVYRFFGFDVKDNEYINDKNDNQDIKDTENDFINIEPDDTYVTKYFYGKIREGEMIQSDGNLVIVGDIYTGGVAVARGNIIVMGTINGMVWAGNDGDTNAYIAAINMNPTHVRICDVIQVPVIKGFELNGLKKLYLSDGQIKLEHIL